MDSEQTLRTTFPVDDLEWRKWLNVDSGIYDRQGVSLKELDTEQKEKAIVLMAASLSAEGLEQSRNIMRTDQTLKELNDNAEHLDEELYFFTIMGTPSETSPWGWQIDGHHLALNYFVLGDQVVFAPAFMGAEPVFTTSGKYEGNVLFQAEQDLGLSLIRSLSVEQQDLAILGDRDRENMVAAGNADNLLLEYEGLQASSLTESQKASLVALITEYVMNIKEGHAEIKSVKLAT